MTDRPDTPPDTGPPSRRDTGPAAPTREERLAAKLRENLHRRKAQAREQTVAAAHAPDGDVPGWEEERAALPKMPPTS